MSDTAQNKENWKKFWKVMAIMPLWFIMPMTAFMKIQAVLAGKDPADIDPSEPVPAPENRKKP